MDYNAIAKYDGGNSYSITLNLKNEKLWLHIKTIDKYC